MDEFRRASETKRAADVARMFVSRSQETASPTSARKVLRDPEFWNLSTPARQKVLLQVDRDFANLPQEEQLKVVQDSNRKLFGVPDAEPAELAPHPWKKVGGLVAFAIGIPLAVLVLGWSVLWALSGFRK